MTIRTNMQIAIEYALHLGAEWNATSGMFCFPNGQIAGSADDLADEAIDTGFEALAEDNAAHEANANQLDWKNSGWERHVGGNFSPFEVAAQCGFIETLIRTWIQEWVNEGYTLAFHCDPPEGLAEAMWREIVSTLKLNDAAIIK